jgi:hypothetical protein
VLPSSSCSVVTCFVVSCLSGYGGTKEEGVGRPVSVLSILYGSVVSCDWIVSRKVMFSFRFASVLRMAAMDNGMALPDLFICLSDGMLLGTLMSSLFL